MKQSITEELIGRQSPEAQALIRLLLARIEELESRLKQSPNNSSLPPSTQHPHARPQKPKSKSKRKRGGQPGHPKQQRTLIPSGECNQIVPLRPPACRRCGEQLTGCDPEPLRHQLWELPQIKPLTTEYQLHRLACLRCGETTCAELPPGVPRGQSGPRLVAFTALLMGCFRQSKRRTAFFLQDFLNLPCCPALTVKMQNQAAAALAEPYEGLRQILANEPQLFLDESPTKQANQKAWLWTAVAPLFAVFAIFKSRKGEAIPQLLGEAFRGVVNCDRAKRYWQVGRLQWCWAHLKRDIQALIDHSDMQVKRLGHDLMRQEKLLFQHWRDYKSGELSWEAFQTCVPPVRREVDALFLRGKFSGNPRLVGMCAEIYKHRDWLWTFVEQAGIEPTNNAAERALRPAVIYRKLSFGTQSAAGSRFVERMLTVTETCRLQRRPLFAYLAAAVEAHFANQPAPSLLPGA